MVQENDKIKNVIIGVFLSMVLNFYGETHFTHGLRDSVVGDVSAPKF